MNGRERIPRTLRRQLILEVLEGEITQAEATRRYGVDKSHVSRLVSGAKDTPERNRFRARIKLDEAHDELKFRERVLEVLAKEEREG